MKLLFTNIRPGRAPQNAPQGNDDTLGRGMDLALTVLVFLVLGWLIDRWLGLFPLFTISLVMFSAIGSFIRMKYVYDATMERHEAERSAKRGTTTAAVPAAVDATVEGAA